MTFNRLSTSFSSYYPSIASPCLQAVFAADTPHSVSSQNLHSTHDLCPPGHGMTHVSGCGCSGGCGSREGSHRAQMMAGGGGDVLFIKRCPLTRHSVAKNRNWTQGDPSPEASGPPGEASPFVTSETLSPTGSSLTEQALTCCVCRRDSPRGPPQGQNPLLIHACAPLGEGHGEIFEDHLECPESHLGGKPLKCSKKLLGCFSTSIKTFRKLCLPFPIPAVPRSLQLLTNSKKGAM